MRFPSQAAVQPGNFPSDTSRVVFVKVFLQQMDWHGLGFLRGGFFVHFPSQHAEMPP